MVHAIGRSIVVPTSLGVIDLRFIEMPNGPRGRYSCSSAVGFDQRIVVNAVPDSKHGAVV